jgi:hypothetical protein
VDAWGFITLAIHLAVSCVRLFTPRFEDQFTADPTMTYQEYSFVAQILVWVSIYYFTFEIYLVYTTILNKDTPKRNLIIMIVKFAMIFLMVLFGALAL